MRKYLFPLATVVFASSCGSGGLSDTDINYSDFGVNVAVRSAPYLTPDNHPAWGDPNCAGCHQTFKHTMATPDIPVEEYQAMISEAFDKVGNRACYACHGTNGAQIEESPQRACLVCHDNFSRLHFYKDTSSRTHSLHDFNGNGIIDDFDCVVCHWQPDMDGIVEPDTDFGKPGGTVKLTVESLCLTCHSNLWLSISNSALADVNGDGTPEEEINPTTQPPLIDYASDWHGDNNFTAGDKPFKDISLGGELLFHTQHEALACSQCHNPHASNNDKLIAETVGESLIVEMPIIQSDNTEEAKYALIDPQTTAFFENLKFSGVVEGDSTTYDLLDYNSLGSYLSLPIKYQDDNDISTARQNMASLCAACHDGTNSYSQINGLGLSIDINYHQDPNAKCNECHSHGSGVF